MVGPLDAAGARRWAEVFLDAAEREAEALGDLDREAGDGDFGTNLVTSIRAARARLGEGAVSKPADAFSALSAAFMATGGTSGPLYGMWYRELAKAAGEAPEIGAAELSAGLVAGLATVRRLGGADVGDKTMIDAMAPAADAITRGRRVRRRRGGRARGGRKRRARGSRRDGVAGGPARARELRRRGLARGRRPRRHDAGAVPGERIERDGRS